MPNRTKTTKPAINEKGLTYLGVIKPIPLKKYTVIVEQPSPMGMESCFGLRHVGANSPEEAWTTARDSYAKDNELSNEMRKELRPLYVFNGHHIGLIVGVPLEMPNH